MLGKDLSFSPCVGLIGMRQVGKSTLLNKFSKRYLSFDQEEALQSIVRRGWDFLKHGDFPLAIDEIQKHPPAFDALKFAIDTRKIPGRYLISGSVRFGSRKGIRESLTGRMTTIELHPLTLAECHSKPPSLFLRLVSEQKPHWQEKLSAHTWCSEAALKQSLVSGGLPGICFRRDDDVKQRLWESHLDTLLTRDIQLIRQVRVSPNKMLIILKELARLQGLPCSISHLARLAGLSVPGTKQILQAMEGLFLLRPYGPTYFVEDVGLGHHLSPWNGTISRHDMIKLLYHEFRVLLRMHFGSGAEATWYTTRGGLEIPFLIKFKTGQTLAIGIDDEDYPSEKVLKSLTWYKKSHPLTKTLVLCRRTDAIQAVNGTLCLPWTWAF
jgi:predicted AAA+ superfamily ATPase